MALEAHLIIARLMRLIDEHRHLLARQIPDRNAHPLGLAHFVDDGRGRIERVGEVAYEEGLLLVPSEPELDGPGEPFGAALEALPNAVEHHLGRYVGVAELEGARFPRTSTRVRLRRRHLADGFEEAPVGRAFDDKGRRVGIFRLPGQQHRLGLDDGLDVAHGIIERQVGKDAFGPRGPSFDEAVGDGLFEAQQDDLIVGCFERLAHRTPDLGEAAGARPEAQFVEQARIPADGLGRGVGRGEARAERQGRALHDGRRRRAVERVGSDAVEEQAGPAGPGFVGQSHVVPLPVGDGGRGSHRRVLPRLAAVIAQAPAYIDDDFERIGRAFLAVPGREDDFVEIGRPHPEFDGVGGTGAEVRQGRAPQQPGRPVAPEGEYAVVERRGRRNLKHRAGDAKALPWDQAYVAAVAATQKRDDRPRSLAWKASCLNLQDEFVDAAQHMRRQHDVDVAAPVHPLDLQFDARVPLTQRDGFLQRPSRR